MNFNSLIVKTVKTRPRLYNYQTFRGYRGKKPFWLGVAKSKMFIVHKPKSNPTPEEREINFRLMYHYNTQFKSLMNFIRFDDPRLTEVVVDENKIGSVMEEKIAQSLKDNERWNNECAKRRDERTQKVSLEEMEKALKELDVREETRMKKMEVLEEIVRKEKQLSATYITPENLDEAIEKCLNNVECFDFAIDTEGNKYHGRETLQPKEKVSAESVS